MVEIKASQVKELRERTGAGMMECKSALTEAQGDMEEAIKILRKKGLAAAAKKAGRITSEGVVGTRVDRDAAAIVEVNCETDFVAQNQDFRNLVSGILQLVLSGKPESNEALLEMRWPDDAEGHTVQQIISTSIAKIGENISLRRFERYDTAPNAVVGEYVHGNGRIGVLVQLEVEAGSAEAWGDVAREVAMHVAAAEPRFLSREEVTTRDLDAEREIAREQALKSGKPEAVVEKIVSGKMEKFYGESVLLEQPYIRDDKLTVQQMLAGRSKDLGGKARIARFTRFKLGEGLEKRSDDFAAEVMAQART
ncbi:MAG TPA: translation elongation factor Ts [Thermoanaerobaculia bacterium]|nr:translation elongation factor Ts [Thermoanaerobaculia bacterium]